MVVLITSDFEKFGDGVEFSQRELAEVKSHFPERQDFFEDLEALLSVDEENFRRAYDSIYEMGKYDSGSMAGFLFFVMQFVDEGVFEKLDVDPMEMLLVSEGVSDMVEASEVESE